MNKETHSFRLVAKTMAGLEPMLARELEQLGALGIEPMTRAVAFEADQTLLYKANYQLRSALKILKPIADFTAANENALYDKLRQLPWYELLSPEKTFSVEAVVFGGHFTHSQYVVHKTKDAIADFFRDRMGIRPSVDVDNPDLRINIHISNEKVNVSIDSSGLSLHKRGYRIAVDKAPINEVLAAGLLMLSNWKADRHFMDAMCGSATLPIEAAMMAMNIPAGYFRPDFAFMRWSDFDSKLWEAVKDEANAGIADFEFEIIGSDRSARALEAASQNLRSAKLHKDIKIEKLNLDEVRPPQAPGLMIINPPYGERLDVNNLIELYRNIGDNLKRHFSGWQVWVISSDFDALKQVGLKPSKKITVFNGPLECRFVCFDIFDGSHREMKMNKRKAEP